MSNRSSDAGSGEERDRPPPKPTRDAVMRDPSPAEPGRRGMRVDPAPTDAGDEGLVRTEIDEEATEPRHPPHVTRSDAGAEIQRDLPSPDEVPILPANAAGVDKLTPDEQHVDIDPESMYNGRPERSKDWEPSDGPPRKSE
jgi:hypothetical protein